MNSQKNTRILKSIAKTISNKLHCDRHGSCVHFAEIFVDEVNNKHPELLDDFDVIEGYVNVNFGDGIPQEHTWVRLKNGDIIDPTFLQFSKYDSNVDYSKKRTKVYSGQEYYDGGKEGSWFSERRKQFPSTVFKEGKIESIRRILREELESKWNTGNKYDYQHGFCHYFAYNIIGRLKKLYPNKNIRYYLILADEVYDFDEGDVEQSYLIHAYIKIDDLYLDSNGFSTEEEIEQRTEDWYNRQLTELPEDYRIDIWHDEYDQIPEHFFNNQFCNTGTIKKDIDQFLSHPEVKKLLKNLVD